MSLFLALITSRPAVTLTATTKILQLQNCAATSLAQTICIINLLRGVLSKNKRLLLPKSTYRRYRGRLFGTKPHESTVMTMIDRQFIAFANIKVNFNGSFKKAQNLILALSVKHVPHFGVIDSHGHFDYVNTLPRCNLLHTSKFYGQDHFLLCLCWKLKCIFCLQNLGTRFNQSEVCSSTLFCRGSTVACH